MVSVPVSIGELIDKLSILQVKRLKVSNESKRLQILEPFLKWEGIDLKGLKLLIKAL